MIAQGSCGKNATYQLYNDGHLIISGTGSTYDQFIFNGVKSEYELTQQVKKITVSSGITSLGDKIFLNMGNVEKIKLSEGLKTIGEWAFGKTGISHIELPNSVISIRDYSFTDV